MRRRHFFVFAQVLQNTDEVKVVGISVLELVNIVLESFEEQISADHIVKIFQNSTSFVISYFIENHSSMASVNYFISYLVCSLILIILYSTTFKSVVQ